MAGTELGSSEYLLSGISAPTELNTPGELSFHIVGPDGAAVTDFETSHDKALHLMVVRSDGQNFLHVHPVLDATTGTWSLPWSWVEAGSYRVFVDITPRGAEAMTLSRMIDVGGVLTPRPATGPVRAVSVGGFDVSITGELLGGDMSDLVVSVSQNGAPVTALEPYLGAFGHLVSLRDGDLSYLHIHPHGDEPQPGRHSGPEVSFMAHTPSEGRYLLFFDFQVAGQVHSAHLVLDAARGTSVPGSPHAGHEMAMGHGAHGAHGAHGGQGENSHGAHA